MSLRLLTLVGLMLVTLGSGAVVAKLIQEHERNKARKTQHVRRVKRPEFVPADWDGIYFSNLFAEGLVGERPQVLDMLDGTSTAKGEGLGAPLGTASGEAPDSGRFLWSALIRSSTIEDEVKSLQRQLTIDLKSPLKFKSEYGKANQSFSVLSWIFAVTSEYDMEVRWAEDAGRAQAAFENAAIRSRSGATPAFESCKRRSEILVDMVRGGKFSGDEKAPESLDWNAAAERTQLMVRLEQSTTRLKTLTANEKEFARNIAIVNHESQIVAAIAATLVKENMTDGDDSGYAEFADDMQKAALSVSAATLQSDYDAASQAVNLLGQSCDDCHAEWK